MKARSLATPLRSFGRPSRSATRPAPEDITVVLDEKFLSQFHASNAAAAVVDASVPLNGKTLVRVKDPLMAFVAIFQRMHGKPVGAWKGVHPTAVIDPTAQIGDDAQIGPHATIGAGTVIGGSLSFGPGRHDWALLQAGRR